MAANPRLPLQYLAAFRAAAKMQNLRAAADSLHLTHSAVSQQIRALETQLGFQLFVRVGRRIALNEAGDALLHGVERAYGELEQGLRAAMAVHGAVPRSLRLTTLPSLAHRWLMPRLARWHQLHPDISLELNTSQQLIDLERDGYHIALRQGRGPWAGLANEPLFESALIAVAAPAVALRRVGQPLAALAQETLLGDAEQWRHWFEMGGVHERVVPMATFNDAGLMLQAAEQGMGIALTRELLAADALLDGRLVRVAPLRLEVSGLHRYHIVYPPTLAQDPALRAFCDWLHGEIALSRDTLASSGAQE